ncbi:MAG: S9 family peptidase [Candidatus Ozemobacteraceae bacterium]
MPLGKPPARKASKSSAPSGKASHDPADRVKPMKVTKEKRPITPEDLLEYQLVGEPRISPDGSQVLFTKRHADEKKRMISNLWIIRIEEPRKSETELPQGSVEPRQITFCGKARQGRFSPDGRRIAFVSGRDKPFQQVFLLDLENGGEARPLSKFPEGEIGRIAFSPDGRTLALTFREQDHEWTEKAKKAREESGASEPPRVVEDFFYRLDGDGVFNRQRFHLYLIDIVTGTTDRIFDTAPLGIDGFTWSPDSTTLAFTANLDSEPLLHPWMDRLYRLDVRKKELTLLPNQEDGTRTSAVWSPDGRYIAFAGRMGFEVGWEAKNMHLFAYDLAKKSTIDLSGSTDVCVESVTVADVNDVSFIPNPIWTIDSKQVITAIGKFGESHLVAFGLQGSEPEFLTEGRRIVKVGSFSDDGKHAAIALGSAIRIDEIYLAERQGKRFSLRQLTHFNDALFDRLLVVEPEPHWIEAEDGHRVQVWSMLPNNAASGKTVPAVLEIHGGPHAQYGYGFFHEFQILTAAGYAVFFGNPRGSKGYGEDHCAVISGDWGNRDWADVQAITAFMRRQPFVNGKRLGVTGGSYGGYMTNWVIGHTTEFAAAITDRCVSNMISMFGNSDLPVLPDTYWTGCAWDRPESLWNQSPLKYFGNVRTPTLIIHSEGDLRCNVEQADQVFTALKILGVPTKLVRYPLSTSHGMSRGGPPDLKLHRLRQILDWLKTYL